MDTLLSLTLLLSLGLAGERALRFRAPAMANRLTLFCAVLSIMLVTVAALQLPWRTPLLLGVPELAGSVAETPAPLPTAPGSVTAASTASTGLSVIYPSASTVWLVGALFGLLVWAAQLLRLRRIVGRARVDERLGARYVLLSRRGLRVAWSSETESAFLWLGATPQVVLPRQYRRLSRHQRRLVVLHELAHHARADNLGLALLRANRVLLWWHPLAWLLENAGRASAELASDEEVIDRGCNALDYAELLLAMSRCRPAAKPVATMFGSSVGARVERLLRPPGVLHKGVAGAFVAMLCAASAAVATVQPSWLRTGSDDWVLSTRPNLTAHRLSDLPPSHLQLATLYDGVDDGRALLAFELANSWGQTRWYRMAPLAKFDRNLVRQEHRLRGDIRPTGRILVSGMLADGIVDGVAVGMAWKSRRAPMEIYRSRSHGNGEVPATVCAWPLAITAERMNDHGRRIPHWEMDALQRLLCGSDLMWNGMHRL